MELDSLRRSNDYRDFSTNEHIYDMARKSQPEEKVSGETTTGYHGTWSGNFRFLSVKSLVVIQISHGQFFCQP